jgi:tripartite-type tricarboxylate transporter receptor subunit TctC
VPLLQHLRSGKLRALAAFSDKRLSVAPDVPALGELGYQNIQIAPIVGVAVPRNTPKEVIAKLNGDIVRALRDPEVNGKLTGLGLEVIGDTPGEFAAFLDSEGKRWLPFIRSLNIKLD